MSVGMASAPLVLEVPAGDASVPRLEVAEWATRFGLVAGITTRAGGFSLGLWNDEPTGQVMSRWRAFRQAFAPRFSTVVLGHQVHGTELRWYDAVPPGWLVLDGVDGHATRQPGVLLTVTVADCVPVYLAVPESGLVALVHAGWRGIADGILERAVSSIRAVPGTRMHDIVIHCGVSICGNCYEVGSEVAERLSGRSDGAPAHVDLRSILAARAMTLGVGAVTVSAYCTAHHHDRFFSHRASQGQDGRLVAYLGRPLP
ncbi:MAG: polyphenol oxidase family protein [Gemmatimonadales bacterium]